VGVRSSPFLGVVDEAPERRESYVSPQPRQTRLLRPHDSRRRSNGSTPPARRQLIEGAETEPHLRRRAEVGPEPEELEQEWTCLIDFVSGRAQLLLDDELVEVAASSPGGHDIDKLPQDL
jgi:hypothetical protein